MVIRALALTLGLLLVFPFPLEASCRRVPKFVADTGVEMEVMLEEDYFPSYILARHLTTTTGALEPLLAGHTFPQSLTDHATRAGGGAAPSRAFVLGLRWADVPVPVRVDILDHIHYTRVTYENSMGRLLPILPKEIVLRVKARIPKLAGLGEEEAFRRFGELQLREIPDDVLQEWFLASPESFAAHHTFSIPVGDLHPMRVPVDINTRAPTFLAYVAALRPSYVGATKLSELPPQLQRLYIELVGQAFIMPLRHHHPAKGLATTPTSFGILASDHVSPAYQTWADAQRELGSDPLTASLTLAPPDVIRDVARSARVSAKNFLRLRASDTLIFQWDQNRSIDGLAPPTSIARTSRRPIQIFGQRHEPGTIVPDAWFEPAVEIIGPTLPPSVGLELKLRVGAKHGVRPSRVVEDTWRLQRAMGLKPTPFHVHVVRELSTDANLPALIELERRLSVIAALTFAEQEIPISVIKSGNLTPFAPPLPELYRDRVPTILALNPSGGEFTVSGIKSHVDLRGSETYGQGAAGRPNIGMDFRIVDPESRWAELAPVLDRTQEILGTTNFGIDVTSLEAWRTERNQSWSGAFQDLLWNRDLGTLIAAMPSHVRERWGGTIATRVEKELTQTTPTQAGTNLQVKLILIDWSRDPVLRGKPEALRTIVAAQTRAMQALTGGGDLVTVSRQFAHEAGLRKLFVESIGARYVQRR